MVRLGYENNKIDLGKKSFSKSPTLTPTLTLYFELRMENSRDGVVVEKSTNNRKKNSSTEKIKIIPIEH